MTVQKTPSNLYIGPVDILLDVPFYMGCYNVLSPTILPTAETFDPTASFTPALCAAQCISQGKRFAGIFWKRLF